MSGKEVGEVVVKILSKVSKLKVFITTYITISQSCVITQGGRVSQKKDWKPWIETDFHKPNR